MAENEKPVVRDASGTYVSPSSKDVKSRVYDDGIWARRQQSKYYTERSLQKLEITNGYTTGMIRDDE